MVLTYNSFKKVVGHSSEKLFNKIAEAISTSDNAALVSMYDDRLIVLDEDKNELFLCNYLYENGILKMHNFEQISLTENDDTYLDEVVDKYFDIDNDEKITVEDLMTGFELKYKNDSTTIFTEAKDRKYRKIMESPRIRAIKKAREARNMFESRIRGLMEEPFMKHLSFKVNNEKDSIPTALNKVSFTPSWGEVTVNTDIGGPANNVITLRDNTNVMDVMKVVASNVAAKWQSPEFRSKFEKMINQILRTESTDLAKDAALNFLDENKELFILKDDLFEELITKTALMYGETDTEELVEMFYRVMKTKEGRIMRGNFLKKNDLTEEKINEINRMVEEDDMEDDNSSDVTSSPDEGSSDSTSSLESEDVKKIVDILKKIKGQLDDDSPEAEYMDGLVSALEGINIDDSKMKEIIDFLSSVEKPSEKKPESDNDDDEDQGNGGSSDVNANSSSSQNNGGGVDL